MEKSTKFETSHSLTEYLFVRKCERCEHAHEQISMIHDLTMYCMGEQKFFDKLMSLFVCRQWLLDSGTASMQGGKARKLHKVIEKRFPKVSQRKQPTFHEVAT